MHGSLLFERRQSTTVEVHSCRILFVLHNYVSLLFPYVPRFLGICTFYRKCSPQKAQGVCAFYGIDSKAVQHRDFCTVSIAFPACSHLAFKANDSSYVFKILIGSARRLGQPRPAATEERNVPAAELDYYCNCQYTTH